MKHFWIGAGLLLGILAGSLWARASLEEVHGPLQARVDQVCEAVLAEDWDRADRLLAQTYAQWERDRKRAAALTVHSQIEEMDLLFSQATLYLALQDRTCCAAACRDLARLAAAATESHRLTWWNLL